VKDLPILPQGLPAVHLEGLTSNSFPETFTI